MATSTIPSATASLAVEGTAQDKALEALMKVREERIFLVLAVIIGIVAALLVVSFQVAIEWITVLLQGAAPAPHQMRLIVVPTLIGLVISLATRYVFPAVRGTGINQTKAAFYIHNGYISMQTMIGKFLLCSLTIGAGFSTGPEDPSLHIGAAIASYIGRTFRLSRERLRLLAPVGAAAGLAAAFNAPISAILFVIEEVIGQWSAGVLGAVVLSAISAVVVARWFWGGAAMFRIPVVNLKDPWEILAYAVLGVIGGAASLFFSKSLGYLRPLLTAQPARMQIFLTPAAGFLVGCIGYFGLPQVMGAGYGAIDQALHAEFALKMLLLLALFKIVATTISISSGSPGGVFAPTLFIGAMLGAAVGSVERHFFPALSGSLGSYALVGMGVLFAAFLRAPLTSVFMVLEVSQNYSIIVPVILANTIAYVMARTIQPISVFEVFAEQDGLLLPSMEERRDETELRLEDALQPVSAMMLHGTQTLADARACLLDWPEVEGASKPLAPFLIQCSDGGWYATTWIELQPILDKALPNAATSTLEKSLPADRTPLLFPDQPLAHSLAFFNRWAILPVFSRANWRKIQGVVTLADVLERFERE